MKKQLQKNWKKTKNQIKRKKTYSDEKKPYLKTNEVCLLSSNFKPASKQKDIQNILIIFIFLIWKRKRKKRHIKIKWKQIK